MTSNMKILRCYVEGSDAGWVAYCFDLDISVQADSFERAIKDLEGAVLLYLETVLEMPEPERSRLLNRRMPLARRAYLEARYLALSLIGRGGGRARHDIPSPDACLA